MTFHYQGSQSQDEIKYFVPYFSSAACKTKKNIYEQLLCHARQSKPPIYWRICDIVKDLILT